ncbi:hypothetical protein K461DRAFT_120159 [Myriangium duriaei CBS 260.36]|uniref:Uncharacterized protein n=1 Tax=Myriangium duriaei CBS 260.36 TaxID=1168546 RepID=A0A9P4J4K8_9PEZI|nr:hypothetical protein K461DRAFT_120159 [Myriangium duriaei CBS 260.36]
MLYPGMEPGKCAHEFFKHSGRETKPVPDPGPAKFPSRSSEPREQPDAGDFGFSGGKSRSLPPSETPASLGILATPISCRCVWAATPTTTQDTLFDLGDNIMPLRLNVMDNAHRFCIGEYYVRVTYRAIYAFGTRVPLIPEARDAVPVLVELYE